MLLSMTVFWNLMMASLDGKIETRMNHFIPLASPFAQRSWQTIKLNTPEKLQLRREKSLKPFFVLKALRKRKQVFILAYS